ncbi:site-specific DNA-methyltransferase [bacterium]|nr:site-specific DNA-methyltransferase [bacterium]
MATGISKNKWEGDSKIISNESYDGDYSFEITYPGKLSEQEILICRNKFEYESILNSESKNKIFFGDNLDVLRFLVFKAGFKEKVKLIYIDPPYGTNSIFQSRNQKSSYKDDLIGSHYLEFLRRRLFLMREMLSNDGSIYVHLDGNMVFQVKMLMDEVFNSKNYRGFITRKKCSNKNFTRKTYGNISDYILFYSKTDNFTWQRATAVWTDEKVKKEYPFIDESTGKRYKKVPIHAPGVRNGETGKEWKGITPPPGKHWQYTPDKLTELDKSGCIYWSANGNPRRKVYFDRDKGVPVQDIWMDVQDSLNQNIKITGYPTEKNPCLLERIITASSNAGDIVLDCFAGSGSTLDVADQLDRSFIGIDNSSEAVYSILKRFVKGMHEMGDYVNKIRIEPLQHFQRSIFDDNNKYITLTNSKVNFEFLSDSRYSRIAIDILADLDIFDQSSVKATVSQQPYPQPILPV